MEQHRPDQAYRIFNTWMGEPSKVQVLKTVLDVIKRDDLLENVRNTGELLLGTLKKFQVRWFRNFELILYNISSNFGIVSTG
jgi:4-aminobutyrate aminotransferase/(S)-3-amino-2-methylpropionate transaminase